MLFRLRDILLSLFLLAGLSWLLGLIVILLAVSQRKVFFVQERTGFQGKPIRMWKFSTLRDILPGEREEDDQRYRLTPLGGILRRLSLDELPQLFHVLTGQMSLVGPRPLLHDYLSLYSERQMRRFEVRPGITGWAQVNGRNAVTFTQRFELDIWYVEHRSFGLDLKIMLMTFGRVFQGRGVYADAQNTMERFDGSN